MSGGAEIVSRIVTEIAAVEETAVTELTPLNDYVDVDALESLVYRTDDALDTDLTLTFRYQGHVITVTDSGTVSVEG